MRTTPTGHLVEAVASGESLNEALSHYLDLLSLNAAGWAAAPQAMPKIDPEKWLQGSAITKAKALGTQLGQETAIKTSITIGQKVAEIPDMVAKGTAKKIDKILKGAGKLPEKGVAALWRTMTGNKARKISKKASAIRRNAAFLAPHVAKAHERNIRGIIRDLSNKRIRERDAIDLLDAALRSIEAEKMAKGIPPYSGPVLALQNLG